MEAQGAGGGRAAAPARTVTHYELLEKLGEGGMGSVFKARDVRLERMVALKFPLPRLLDSPDLRSRFMREGRALSSLNHPNIATVFEVDEAGGTPFLALEYLPGGTLRGRIRAAAESGRPIPFGEIVEWSVAIVDGLAHAHRQGIVHRDVKSGNVMFGAEGRPKLTDFGLAKVTAGADHSSSGSVVGTFAYMSPEQASGGSVDQRSDLYSLGVVMYEAATGRMPFEGDSPAAVVHKIMEEEPAPPSRLRADLPPAFDSIVLKLLDKEPARRYQRGEELAKDLRALGEAGEKSIFRAVTVSLRRPLRWRGARRRWLVAGIVAALLATAGVYTAYRPAQRWVRGFYLPKQMHLAVLPFRSLGGDAGQQAFSDGLTETLTTALTKHGSFSVLSGTDARWLDSAEAARAEFGVNLVISGSIQWRSDQVRMTMHLVDTAGRRQIASETIDCARERLSELEPRLFSVTADLLNLLWSREAASLPVAGASQSPAVYDAYLRGRGFLYRYDQAGNLDRAVGEFETAVRQDPMFALAHVGLAEAHVRRYLPTRDQAVLQAAGSAAQEALKLNPALASAHLWHGRVLAESGKPEQAVVELQRAISLDPRDPAGYRELANVYQMQRRDADAEGVFKEAVSVRPGDWMSHSNLAAFYTSRQRHAEAEAEFRRVIEVTPSNPFGYRNLAAVLIRLGKNREAEAMLRKALELRSSAATYSNLATLLMLEKKYAEAVGPMEKAAELLSRDRPRDYRIWGNLGDAYWLAQSPPEKKLAAWRRAAEVAEAQLTGAAADAVLLSILAKYHAKLGDRPTALRRISAALGYAPTSADVRYQAGLTYALLGEKDRALAELAEAVRLKYSLDVIRQAPELLPLTEDLRFQKLTVKANTR